jgi:hypothetical protein
MQILREPGVCERALFLVLVKGRDCFSLKVKAFDIEISVLLEKVRDCAISGQPIGLAIQIVHRVSRKKYELLELIRLE